MSLERGESSETVHIAHAQPAATNAAKGGRMTALDITLIAVAIGSIAGLCWWLWETR